MATTVKTGWLHDKNGDKFAPKTLVSQVQNNKGETLETTLANVTFFNSEDNENVEVPEKGGTSIDVTAEVGQTIVVKEVDADGKPTKWEAADYQPLTHWSEEGQEVIVPELTFTPFLNESMGVYQYPLAQFELIEGKTYTVIFDGISYTCSAFTGTLESLQFIALGNTALAGGENTGEPFALGVFDTFIDGVCARRDYMIACFDGDEHTVRIIEDKLVPHKIPKEYITPDFFYVSIYSVNNSIVPFCLLTPWEHIIEAVKSGKVIFIRNSGLDYEFDQYGNIHTYYMMSNLICVSAKISNDSLECSLKFMMTGSIVTGDQLPLLIIERDKDGVTTFKTND